MPARALATGDETGLLVLGYGEISTVGAAGWAEGKFACKRLSPFRSERALAGYRRCLAGYLAKLQAAGIEVVPTTLETVLRDDGQITAFCVQPILGKDDFMPKVFARVPPEEAVSLFDDPCDRIERAAGPRLGIDGQWSNWALVEGRIAYLDVTTPFVRDEQGRDELDVGLFLAALPWVLRGAVRRFVFSGILGKYFEPRGVVLDLLANLIKKRPQRHLPALVARAPAASTGKHRLVSREHADVVCAHLAAPHPRRSR